PGHGRDPDERRARTGRRGHRTVGRGRLRRHHRGAVRHPRRARLRRPPAVARGDEPDPRARRRPLDRELPLPRALQAALRLGRARRQRRPRGGAPMTVTEKAEAAVSRATPDVRLEHVTKEFDDVRAVDDLSLEIEHGSFFALLGPSGCGKTTTLRMIGGFEQPTEGTIYLGDEPVSGRPPYKRDVNTVFQSYALFPHLTIFENVAFGLRRRGVRGGDVRGRVLDILHLVGLEGLEKRKPRQLSGGQQQRVALARALVNKPRVLLLDEPLGALDLKLRKQMQLELKAIQNDVGITFIHVTHDQEEAMTMADRIAIMNAGRIEQLGTPSELYERPRTAFVASFLGISNLLPGNVTGPGSVRLDDGTEVRVPEAILGGRSGKVAVGV